MRGRRNIDVVRFSQSMAKKVPILIQSLSNLSLKLTKFVLRIPKKEKITYVPMQTVFPRGVLTFDKISKEEFKKRYSSKGNIKL